VHNSIAMSPRTTPTEITTANTTEISNRNSAGAESDSSIDLAIKEFVGAVGMAGKQYVMLSGMRSFRLSIELFRYAALLREYMRIETIIKHLLFLLNLSHFLKGLFLDFPTMSKLLSLLNRIARDPNFNPLPEPESTKDNARAVRKKKTA